MTDKERIANLETQLHALGGIVAALMYQLALRSLIPLQLNDDLVKDLDAIAVALKTPAKEQDR